MYQEVVLLIKIVDMSDVMKLVQDDNNETL